MSKIVEISLNDKLIKGPSDKNKKTSTFSVQKNNTLIINGGGVVDGNSNSLTNHAITINGGHVIINGGKFTVGNNINNSANSCIYIKEEHSILEINDGEFHANTSDKNINGAPWVPIIDVKNNLKRTRYSVSIKGGTFYGYNPENGDEAMKRNFVAEGYHAVPSGYYIDDKGNKLIIYKVEPK